MKLNINVGRGFTVTQQQGYLQRGALVKKRMPWHTNPMRHSPFSESTDSVILYQFRTRLHQPLLAPPILQLQD